MKDAVSYIRVSIEEQADSGSSKPPHPHASQLCTYRHCLMGFNPIL
jgi:hypothetical protein